MPSISTDTQSLQQNPLIHSLLWFVVISICGYLLTDRSLLSALSTATVSAVFYGGLVYLWNVY
jgi:hypothetical protein